jgi:hypothetical protein
MGVVNKWWIGAFEWWILTIAPKTFYGLKTHVDYMIIYPQR